ncbi:MAG: hypothetical protein ACKO7P_12295, partial [Bacteroidota bacterium]
TQNVVITKSSTALLFGSCQIGNVNTPTVQFPATNVSSLQVRSTASPGNLTIKAGSTLDLSSMLLNRQAAGGAFSMEAGSTLRLSGTTGGQTGSNFPLNYTTSSPALNANSTVEYYASSNQTIYDVVSPGYGNLSLTGAATQSTSTALDIQGALTIGSGATFSAGTSLTHNIGGDWTNNGTFSYTTGSTINFNGSSNQAVGGTVVTSFNNLTNANASTGLTLGYGILVNGTLSMSGATANIDLNGYNIDLSSAGRITGESNIDRIYGASGSITTTRTLNAPSAINVGGMGLILTSASNLGSTTITRQHTDLTNGDFSSLTRNYQISPTNNSGLNATITFNYFDNELNGLSTQENDFSLWRSTDGGSTWTQRNGTITSASNYISLASIDAFSLWTVGPSSGVVLSSKIIDFNVSKKENKVALKWVATNEQETEYYEVEASFDGIHFHPLSSIDVKKNHVNSNTYLLFDDNYVNGVNYYRLKSIDYDGSEDYTKTISIDITKYKTDLVMTVNSLGQRIDNNYSGVVFDIYSDGSSIKRIQ